MRVLFQSPISSDFIKTPSEKTNNGIKLNYSLVDDCDDNNTKEKNDNDEIDVTKDVSSNNLNEFSQRLKFNEKSKSESNLNEIDTIVNDSKSKVSKSLSLGILKHTDNTDSWEDVVQIEHGDDDGQDEEDDDDENNQNIFNENDEVSDMRNIGNWINHETPSRRLIGRNSMSPITKSTQRMPKSMQVSVSINFECQNDEMNNHARNSCKPSFCVFVHFLQSISLH